MLVKFSVECHANTFVKVDAQIMEECRQTINPAQQTTRSLLFFFAKLLHAKPKQASGAAINEGVTPRPRGLQLRWLFLEKRRTASSLILL